MNLKKKSIFNFFALLTLGTLGAVLGGEYTHLVPAFFLSAMIAYAIVIQIFSSNNDNISGELEATKKELSETKDKLSDIFLTNKISEVNNFYLAIMPTSTVPFKVNTQFGAKVIINMPFEIATPPDLKIITEDRWTIRVANNYINPSQYAGRYEYTLPSSSFSALENCSDKYFAMEISIQIHRSGVHDFSIIAETRDHRSHLNNSFDVIP